MKSKILSMFLFLFFLLQYLFTSSSFAQTPNQEEWKRSFLEGLLGELPNACYSFDPFCFKCLVYMKILPMMFFFLLFFLLFYLIVWESLASRPSSPLEVITGQAQKRMTQREVKISAMLALVMSIVLLHYGTPDFAIRNLSIWMGIFLFIGTLLLFRGFARATVAFLLLQVIIAIIMLSLFVSYINMALYPQVDRIISQCMGEI